MTDTLITLPAQVAIKRGDVISVIQSYEVEAVGRRSGRTFKIQFEGYAAQPTLRRPIGIALNDAQPGHAVRIMTQGDISLAEVDFSQFSQVYMPVRMELVIDGGKSRIHIIDALKDSGIDNPILDEEKDIKS